MSSDTSTLQRLVDDGWRTHGEIIEGGNRAYLWYEKSDDEPTSAKVPSCPDEDEFATYSWQRVCDFDAPKYEKDGWMTRKLCDKTNRLWMCRRK